MSKVSDAYAMLVTKLSQITGIPKSRIARVSALNEIALETLLRDGNISLPCLILWMGEDYEHESGLAARASVTPVKIGYITENTDGDTLEVLDAECELIKFGLFCFQQVQGSSVIQILELPTKNVDLSNDFNLVLLSLSSGLVAGCVTAQVIHGDVA